jgi:hypothetical protein
MGRVVTEVKAKPIAKKEESSYQSGFCTVGSHENTQNKGPSGAILKACPVAGRFEMFGYNQRMIGVAECTCFCHVMSRQMEELSGVKFPVRSSIRDGSALSGLGLLGTTSPYTNTGKAAVSDEASRPTVAVASGATFVATPSGRAARGQLEEQVRHVISVQVNAGGSEMIAMLGLMPSTLGLMIDADDPPSSGAIYAVLKRWEKQALVDLAESPFRFVRFTERGTRDLLR